ncbi:MAG TPA: alpha/beta hydrolase [Acetobacteraceae bacterium]|nr:alpha/beta hydrolase [Acetobacteraceae bacterium]
MDWGSLTRAERDAAYNNTGAVPDSATYHAARRAASDAFRAKHDRALDLPYGARERNRLDLFPGDDPAAPCLVFIHGGYWQMNSKEGFASVAAGVAAHGWSAALPGYSLAPDASLTDIVAEIRQALDWLEQHGPEFGVTGPLIVSGWSAGGHLAAMALDHRAVAGGLGISGIYELGPLRDTYLDAKLRLSDAEIAALSPLRLPVVPKPFLLAYGTAELPALIANSRELHARRSAAHAPGPLLPLAGRHHFSILAALEEPAGELTRQVLLLDPRPPAVPARERPIREHAA